jgi:hypothetical protein
LIAQNVDEKVFFRTTMTSRIYVFVVTIKLRQRKSFSFAPLPADLLVWKLLLRTLLKARKKRAILLPLSQPCE